MSAANIMETAAWQHGAELAFAMLRKIEATSLDETAYEPMFRDSLSRTSSPSTCRSCVICAIRAARWLSLRS